MKKITRREFIGAAGATLGTLVVGKTVLNAVAGETPEEQTEGSSGESEWLSSTCQMCPGQCGIEVRIIDGKVIKINPGSHNPGNFSNDFEDFSKNHLTEKGVLCPKGCAGIAALYEPDRIAKPMKRTNPEKGMGIDPQWQPISWDEAYLEIVAKLKELLDKDEAEKLLWFADSNVLRDIQQDFCKLYGTPNVVTDATLSGAASRSVYNMMGLGHRRPDYLHAKHILIFGANPFGSLDNGYLPRVIQRAREAGSTLVVVDPHMTVTAAKADHWVPIKPGTDGALALAMANVIIAKGLYNKAFVEGHTSGFDLYTDYVKDKTPEWAEKITGIPADLTTKLALELVASSAAVVCLGAGVEQYSNGFNSAWAIMLLAALTGQIDKKGTMLPAPERAAKPLDIKPDKQAATSLNRPRFDGGKAKYTYADDLVYAEVLNRLLDGKGAYQAKMGMVIGQNPVMSVPGTQTIINALKQLKYLVVVDTLMSETAVLADIVLPGSTYLERYDLLNLNVNWPAVALVQPVVAPYFGQPTEYEIITELGRRLKLKEASGKEFFDVSAISHQRIEDKKKWYEDYLSLQLSTGIANITLEKLKIMPGAVWMAEPGHRDQLSQPSKILFALKNKTPEYTPIKEQESDAYRFACINWSEASHTGAYTQNNAYLINLKRHNPLVINTETAKTLSLRLGDKVIIESAYGKAAATVCISETIRPDVVGLQKGFGHWELGKMARGMGTNDGVLRPTHACSLSGQIIGKECFVKISKA